MPRRTRTRVCLEVPLASTGMRSWSARRLRTGAVLVGVLVLLSACGGTAQTSRDIEGTWIWDSANVAGDPFSLDPELSTREIPGVPGWLRFDADRTLTGEGPCNRIRSRWRVDGDLLAVENATVTAVACVGRDGGTRIMDAEAVLIEPLLAGETFMWDASDDELTLRTSRTRLRFHRRSG